MPHVDRPWDVETDLMVMGAGAAGMTAALVGALEGLQVILCEKSDKVGGTTAICRDRLDTGKPAEQPRRHLGHARSGQCRLALNCENAGVSVGLGT